MATVSAHGDAVGATATFDASQLGVVLRPRQAVTPAQPARSSCCRCRQPIVLGVIASTYETWVTVAEGDPWCQGGAHLPKGVHLDGE